MIYEVIVTTKQQKGNYHVAPMGISKKEKLVLLKPFKPSRTLENILASGYAVVNVTSDVRFFAGSVTNNIPFKLSETPDKKGVYLSEALNYSVLSLMKVEDSEERPTLYMKPEKTKTLRDFFGFNRAQFAVIEASILISRLGIISQKKIDTELRYLEIAFHKTAGKREKIAWNWLMNKYNDYLENSDEKT